MVLDGATRMTSEQFSNAANAGDSVSLLRQFCLIGGAGVVSGAVTLAAFPAQASADLNGEPPTSVEAVPPIPPVETSAELLLKPQVTAAPVVEPVPANPPALMGSLNSPTVQGNSKSLEAAAEPALPSTTEKVPAPANIEHLFIDPTDYSLGATPSPEGPSIVFSNRSTGCEFTVDQGQTVGNTCGAAAASASLGTLAAEDARAAEDASGISIGPVNIGGHGVTVGGTTVISREYFNEKVRPLNMLRQRAEEFIFPLSIPAPITSLFGWRKHPLFGDRRFHTGTDLGAPEGTPVLATKDGTVHVADYLGGYGYTVILRHENGSQETRYAHLAQILVQPGESVQQGEVVGLVGSTGNSTGPHLHFELRELTAHGWMLTDPDQLMNYTVTSLVEAINNPLQALGLIDENAKDENDGATLEEGLELPYRPAQPNAS